MFQINAYMLTTGPQKWMYQIPLKWNGLIEETNKADEVNEVDKKE